MMLHGRLRRARLREPPMVPMINIVFLLLLYFMLAGSLNEQSVSLIPPVSHSSDRPETGVLVITATRSGFILIEGAEINPADLAAVLADRLGDARQARIQLAADEASPSRVLHQVIDASQALGVRQIQLLTRPGT